ncbi:Chromosome alignment-maintaining phosphoprotein 1 [Bagarius yarrelli]|uniref:Chromosome alignment-maintaining phosphoprotein 1 n=1 Tax=Bagarius yarrelli TaxID=175774 RepID=A0A556VX15_BAGYA|nr:Chromosome alignment-maintaining phosphoprotein 1 [Bagarius yarrelli]
MEMESSAPACDQIDSPQGPSRSPGRDAEDPEAETQSGDVKRRTSGIRCPYCCYRCRAAFSFQIHVGSQHPVHCEDVSVGRLGKAVFYQRTAKLFHCHICFFTSKDHAVVLDHLLVRHCCVHTAEGPDGVNETELDHVEGRKQEPEQDLTEQHKQHSSNVDSLTRQRSSVSNGQDKDRDVDMSDSSLQHRPGVHQCPYCQFRCSLLDLHQHLSECKTVEKNRNRGEAGTEEDEEDE